MKKTLTLGLLLALLSALLTTGCQKDEAPKPSATPVSEKKAPGQEEGEALMRQHGGNPQSGQPGQAQGGR